MQAGHLCPAWESDFSKPETWRENRNFSHLPQERQNGIFVDLQQLAYGPANPDSSRNSKRSLNLQPGPLHRSAKSAVT
jgi:hypothetical protein